MNATSKGNIYEIQVQRILEKDGWAIFRQHRKAMFIKGRMIMAGCDMFGADMIALKKDRPIKFVQVTTLVNKSAKEKEYAKHPFIVNHMTREIWCKIPRKDLRRFICEDGIFWLEKPCERIKTKD